MEPKRGEPNFITIGMTAVLFADCLWILMVIPLLARANGLSSSIFDEMAAPLYLLPAWESDSKRLVQISPELGATFRFVANLTMLEALASGVLFCGLVVCVWTTDAGRRFASHLQTMSLGSGAQRFSGITTIGFAVLFAFFATHGSIWEKAGDPNAIDQAIRELRGPVGCLIPLKCSLLLLVFARQGK
jgi:hypothetical protein